MAGLVGSIQDFVVEDGEVQGKTQADGVRGRQLGLSDLRGSLISLEGLIRRLLASVANSELS